MYKLFLTLRYLRRRYIAYFAIAAVMLCTFMVLIVMSVMGGFLDQLKLKARGLLGDVIIDNRSYSGFPMYEEFIADIERWTDDDGDPLIVEATPVIYSFGLLRYQGTPETHTVRVVGIRMEEVFQVNAFEESLYYHTFYPGTTHLQEQRQPLLGFDTDAEPITWRDEDGERIGEGPPPRLPPKYQRALAASWEAGLRDEETVGSEWAALSAAAGRPAIVGVYEAVDGFGPPRMAGEPYPGLIIGRDIIAKRLPSGAYRRYWLYPRGCVVTLTLIPTSVTGTVDTPVKQPFRYADDSRTAIYEIDSQHVYCDFALLQQLLQMQATDRVNPETGAVIGQVPGRASQIQIKLAPGVKAEALCQRLAEHYHTLADDPRLDMNDKQLISAVEAMTWAQSQAHIIAPVEKERQLVTILFGIISLVAAVLVLCILYMIVLQKTRDIGIVKSIGGSSAGLAMVFITYGAAVGVVGAIVGLIGGYYFVTYINEIQTFLTQLNPAWQVWDRSVYSFDEIPNTVRGGDMVVIFIAAVALSTLGSVLAAWRAGAMQPVEALRYE